MRGPTQISPCRSLRLDVALAPAMSTHRNSTVAIVVDVIRATTTLAVMFEHGCRRVLVAPDITNARAAHIRLPTALLAGEANGAAPPGFDLGNSPAEMHAQLLAGREVIFATTNGTRALRACADARAVYAGSLRNAHAVCAAALAEAVIASGAPAAIQGRPSQARPYSIEPSESKTEEQPADILVVCAGRGDRPSLDDTLCAGYLCRELLSNATNSGRNVSLGEGARIAVATLRDALASGSLSEALATSDAARAISAIGLVGDLAWCAATDASLAVPRVTGHDEDGLLIVEN
ncbi:MAG TPA: 2-phosphosulfolactate phosphatase [Ktedonobacterales bacterium]|nr:2-phosphosulfolactate phosphatase [Ktedonobacterales bacterium]